MLLGLGLGLGAKRVRLLAGAAVVALFANSEQGLWFDPSDLSTMFVENTGRTPAGPGDQVGLILDKRLWGGKTLPQVIASQPELITSQNLTTWSNGGAFGNWLGSTATTDTITTISGSDGSRYLRFPCIPGDTIRAAANAEVIAGIPAISIAFGTSSNTYISNIGNQTVMQGGVYAIAPANAAFFEIVIKVVGSSGSSAKFTNITTKKIPGNHATQPTAASKPILARHPEGGRRNLLTYSEDFTNSAWTKDGITITPNVVTAPNGTLTADLLLDVNADIGYHTVYQDIGAVGGGAVFARSVYVKQYLSQRYVTLGVAGVTSSASNTWIFDFQTGSFILTGSNGAGQSIEALSDGWYRLTILNISSTSNNNKLMVGLATAATGFSDTNYTADGTRGVYIWGGTSELTSTTPYQKVVSTHDVSEIGQRDLWFLFFDGTDDFLVTNSFAPGTDKLSILLAATKLRVGGTAQIILESSSSPGSNVNTFWQTVETAFSFNWASSSRGTVAPAIGHGALVGPDTVDTAVISVNHDIGGNLSTIRRNGIAGTSGSSDKGGSGPFGNYPVYIGRRGGSSLPWLGRLYGLVIRAGLTQNSPLEAAEKFMAGKIGISI